MKLWLGRMRGYWEKWNQVYLNQVSYEDDRAEGDYTVAMKTTESKVVVLEIDRIHQFS